MKWRLAIVALFFAAGARAAELEPPKLSATIALPGVEGRFDHAAMDAATHRLFLAALGNNTLETVDVGAGKRLHTITGLQKPTGVAFLGELNLVAVANGDDGTCRFYDGTSYAERGRVAGLDDADNLRYDAKAQRLYCGYGEGALGVIDPKAMKIVGRIPLVKHPESFQLEENGPRIFANVPEAKQIAVVDRTAGKLIATWPVESAHANFPMALDEARHCLFVGCRQPPRLLVLDTDTGKPIGETTMSGDVDDLFFDATGSRVLASCGEGFVDVFSFSPPAKLTRAQQLATAAGARTSFFSGKARELYLAIPHRGDHPAEIRTYSFNDR